MLTATVQFTHIPPHKHIHDIRVKKQILDYRPEEVVDMALQALNNAGVGLIEWRALLYRRMNVPVRLTNYSYLVPDDDVDGASAILASLGLPLTQPTKFHVNCFGDFTTQGRFYRITQTTLTSGVQHLVLYPQSFSTLSTSDLTEEAPFHLSSSTLQKISVPRPSAVYASILRMMSRYPRYCSTRSNLMSDLSELIGYHLYGLDGGFVDTDDEELMEELGVDKRVSDAVYIVRQWNWDEEWREGEEWIGDALEAIVAGDDMDNLPWRSDPS